MKRSSTILICFALILLSLSPSQASSAPEPSRTPQHFIVLVDRSGSRSVQQLADMRIVLQRLVYQLSWGDQLRILEVMQSDRDRIREFARTMPTPESPGSPSRRDAIVSGNSKRALMRFGSIVSDTAGVREVRWTDLLATLRRAGDYVRGNPQQPTIIILSDMLHSTPELQFERIERIPAPSWLAVQKELGLLPSFGGVCIMALGVETGSTRAVRARRFWESYFQTTGASLHRDDYRAALVSGPIECRR